MSVKISFDLVQGHGLVTLLLHAQGFARFMRRGNCTLICGLVLVRVEPLFEELRLTFELRVHSKARTRWVQQSNQHVSRANELRAEAHRALVKERVSWGDSKLLLARRFVSISCGRQL